MMALLLRLIVIPVIFSLQISAGTYCVDNIFLRAGSQGVVSCDFGEFDVVGWLIPTKKLEDAVPFIYLEDSEIRGPESGSGEYSMLPNGSLVIENVTVSHEKNYIVRIVKNGEVLHHDVPVKVYVLPIPEYPVVNGQTGQERVLVHSSNGKASLNCTMDRIRPAVPLELIFISPISNGISAMTTPSTLNNSDGTYNVSLDILLTDINLPSGTYFLECRVAESYLHRFTSVSAIDLSVFDGRYNFPLVNGLDSQQHVVLDVNRQDALICSMNRVPRNVYLVWDFPNSYSLAELTLERQSNSSVDNGDGTYNITSITQFKVKDDSVQIATVKCVVSGKAADMYPLFTTVELLFPVADWRYNFPLVNGLDSQQHVVLDVNREGALNCSMNRVSHDADVEWKFINGYSLDEISLETKSNSSLDNGDGTYNITVNSIYRTTDESVQFVTLKCMVSGKAADLYPLFTTVELHFPELVADTDSLHYVFVIIFILTSILLLLFLVRFHLFLHRSRKNSKKIEMDLRRLTEMNQQLTESRSTDALMRYQMHGEGDM